MIYSILSPFTKIKAKIEEKTQKNKAILFIKTLCIKKPKFERVLESNKFKEKLIIRPECKKL